MYSTHSEEKIVAAKRFIRALKNKIFKHMTAISKTWYVDKLKNTTIHIKMKPVDVKSKTYINFLLM